MVDPPLVSPELLRYVDDYIQEEDVNRAAREDELDAESNLIVFYREVFAQLFANVLHDPITGFRSRSGERARALYRRKGSSWPATLRQLVRDYQHFCKIYPDLLGDMYGSSEAVGNLHVDLLPTLLGHLEAWAREGGHLELVSSVGASRQRYDNFIADLEPLEL